MNLDPASGQHQDIREDLRSTITPLGLFSAAVILVSPALAQTDDSQVHITPKAHASSQGSPVKKTTSEPRSALTKPLVANVELVLVPVTVTDPMNRAIIGLEKSNFVLSEDNRPQVIQSFHTEDAPLSLGVIFDTSKSMSNKMEQARDAVLAFFKTANPQDDFFIVTFSDSPQLLVDFTTSVEHIENRLNYALPHGHTSLLDAIYIGLSKVRHSQYQRRALLIISDGGDNHSRYSRGEIKRLV